MCIYYTYTYSGVFIYYAYTILIYYILYDYTYIYVYINIDRVRNWDSLASPVSGAREDLLIVVAWARVGQGKLKQQTKLRLTVFA